MDLRCVVTGHSGTREQKLEQTGAGICDFVENKGRLRELCKDREQAGTRGGFEHEIGRRDRCRGRRGKPQRDWRRKLLQRLRFLGSPRLRWRKRRKLRQHREKCVRCAGAREHGRAEFAKEQNLGRLAGIVCELPIPRAPRVRGIESRLHRVAHHMGFQRLPSGECFDQGRGSFPKRRRRCARGTWGGKRGNSRGRRRGRCRKFHERVSESVSRWPGRALSSPAGSHLLPGRPFPLVREITLGRFDQEKLMSRVKYE